MRKQRDCECPPLSVSALSLFSAHPLHSFRTQLHEKAYQVRKRYAMPHSILLPHEQDADAGLCGQPPLLCRCLHSGAKKVRIKKGLPPPSSLAPICAQSGYGKGIPSSSFLPPLQQKHEQRDVRDKTSTFLPSSSLMHEQVWSCAFP
jgi:hypothetical protein